MVTVDESSGCGWAGKKEFEKAPHACSNAFYDDFTARRDDCIGPACNFTRDTVTQRFILAFQSSFWSLHGYPSSLHGCHENFRAFMNVLRSTLDTLLWFFVADGRCRMVFRVCQRNESSSIRASVVLSISRQARRLPMPTCSSFDVTVPLDCRD